VTVVQHALSWPDNHRQQRGTTVGLLENSVTTKFIRLIKEAKRNSAVAAASYTSLRSEAAHRLH